MAYFTKFAIQYAMEDQEEEWRAEFEGKVRLYYYNYAKLVTSSNSLPQVHHRPWRRGVAHWCPQCPCSLAS